MTTAREAIALHLLILRCQTGDERAFGQLWRRLPLKPSAICALWLLKTQKSCNRSSGCRCTSTFGARQSGGLQNVPGRDGIDSNEPRLIPRSSDDAVIPVVYSFWKDPRGAPHDDALRYHGQTVLPEPVSAK